LERIVRMGSASGSLVAVALIIVVHDGLGPAGAVEEKRRMKPGVGYSAESPIIVLPKSIATMVNSEYFRVTR
jgi:hypothetical protein